MRTLGTNIDGATLRDAAHLAVARVEAISGLLPPPWEPADEAGLRAEAGRQLSGQAHAAAMIGPASDPLVAGIALVPILAPGGPFGSAWTAHPFASPAMTAGYTLREPDITRALAALMGPCGGRNAHTPGHTNNPVGSRRTIYPPLIRARTRLKLGEKRTNLAHIRQLLRALRNKSWNSTASRVGLH